MEMYISKSHFYLVRLGEIDFTLNYNYPICEFTDQGPPKFNAVALHNYCPTTGILPYDFL